MICGFIGSLSFVIAASMWLMIAACDQRRWDAEYRRTEDDRQAEIVIMMK